MYQIQGHHSDFPLVVKRFQFLESEDHGHHGAGDHAEVVGIPACSGSRLLIHEPEQTGMIHPGLTMFTRLSK